MGHATPPGGRNNFGPATFPIAKRVYVAVDEDRERARRRVAAAFEGIYGRGGLDHLAVYGPPDECARAVHEAADAGADFLCVSNFTLYGDARKGNRPSFVDAAPPEEAEPLYEAFCGALRDLGVPVATGVFGARMAIELENEGPVTIVL